MTAWIRSRSPSLRSTAATWVFTVASLTHSSRGDLGVGRPRASRAQRLALARVRSSSAGASPRRAAAGRVALDQPPRDRRREQRLAAGDGADGADQLARGTSLSRKPLAPARSALVDVLVEVEGRQHRARAAPDAGARRSAASPRCRRARACGRPSARRRASSRARLRPPRRRRRPRRPPRCRAGRRGSSRSPSRTSSWSSTMQDADHARGLERERRADAEAAAAPRARRRACRRSSATRSRMPTRPWPPPRAPWPARRRRRRPRARAASP